MKLAPLVHLLCGPRYKAAAARPLDLGFLQLQVLDTTLLHFRNQRNLL